MSGVCWLSACCVVSKGRVASAQVQAASMCVQHGVLLLLAMIPKLPCWTGMPKVQSAPSSLCLVFRALYVLSTSQDVVPGLQLAFAGVPTALQIQKKISCTVFESCGCWCREPHVTVSACVKSNALNIVQCLLSFVL